MPPVVVPGKHELIALTANSIATVTGDLLTDLGKYGRSMILTVVLADKQGTVTFTPKIQKLLKDGSTYVDYWIAAAALSANGSYNYVIGRDAATMTGGSLGIVEARNIPLPRDFRVVLTYSGAGSGNSFDCYAEGEVIP